MSLIPFAPFVTADFLAPFFVLLPPLSNPLKAGPFALQFESPVVLSTLCGKR